MKITLTVTNDLTYDQRMLRICSSLAHAGHEVTLVGRQLKSSKALIDRPYQQKRLRCWINKGKFFYAEFNIRLFFYLLFARFDAICSIDLDTILPGFYVANWRNKICVYDAHEYFTEVPELVARPKVKRIWEGIARRVIPQLKHCYTVCISLAELFEQNYGTKFQVIRNVPFALKESTKSTSKPVGAPKIFLYQGALNDGRGIEESIQAMRHIEGAELWLAGEGDCSAALRQLAKDCAVTDKVKFLGYVLPADLKAITLQADIGLNLLHNKGLNYYYSLSNKYFDYIQAGIPSINMNFPEFKRVIKEFRVALLIDNLKEATVLGAFKELMENEVLYTELQENCKEAAKVYTWEIEEKKLVRFYEALEKNYHTP